jgi:hypothetical protein
LRDELGFDGLVVTDWDNVNTLWSVSSCREFGRSVAACRRSGQRYDHDDHRVLRVCHYFAWCAVWQDAESFWTAQVKKYPAHKNSVWAV